jgi:hypothetical protein
VCRWFWSGSLVGGTRRVNLLRCGRAHSHGKARQVTSISGSVADPDPGSGVLWPLDPESGIGKKSGSGSGIRIQDEQPKFYFRELRNHFFWLKYLNSLMRIRDPGWKKFGSRIRNKHPGSATLNSLT